jgi:hypothetical protein
VGIPAGGHLREGEVSEARAGNEWRCERLGGGA